MPDPRRCGQPLLDLARQAGRLDVVAPFITTAGFNPILEALPPTSPVTVYTRWIPAEVAAGVSDPGIWDLIEERAGGSIWLHPSLHAKVYLSDTVCLIGSANVTNRGLGWGEDGGIEILAPVSLHDPHVQALMALLRAVSSPATSSIRDLVLTAAQDVAATDGLRIEGGKRTACWLPQYHMPDVLWKVYNGERGPAVSELVDPDLKALDVPPGLDEAGFNRHVAVALQQGLAGRVLNSCMNRSSYHDALARFRETLAQAGIRTDDEGITNQWSVFVRWIQHFLPGIALVPAQYVIFGSTQ